MRESACMQTKPCSVTEIGIEAQVWIGRDSPALHVQHPFLPASITLDQARVRTHPDATTPGGAFSTGRRG